MWSLLLSAWFGAALAAVPVQLPAGEPAGAWSEAARLAGVTLGSAAGPPSARIVAQDGRWTVSIVARDGTRHTLVVPAPASAAAREDLLATVVSLAEPVSASLPGVALPPLPAAPPPPKPTPRPVARPAPKPVAKPTPPPAPPPGPPAATAHAGAATDPASAGADPAVAAVDAERATAEPPVAEAPAPVPEPPVAEAPAPVPEPEPDPEPVATPEPVEPEPLDLDAREPEPSTLPLHARLSTGAAVRLDAAPVPFVELAGGVDLGPLRAGLAVAAAPNAPLDADRALRWLDVSVLADAGDLGPWGALRVGAAVRGWTEGGAFVTTTVTPTARLDLGWGFALGRERPGRTRLRPGAWVAADLAPTTLYVSGVEERDLDRAFFGIDIGIEVFRAAK